MGSVVANVVVPRPLPGPLSYLVPADLMAKIAVGSLVRVPFRSRVSDGFVVEMADADDPKLEGIELKEVLAAPFPRTVFTAKDLDFFRWVSEYYQLPLGEVFHSAFPRSIFDIPAKPRKVVGRDAPAMEWAPRNAGDELELTSDQAIALNAIGAALNGSAFKSFLLHGVTGSGKTEVYIRAARATLRRSRAAIILVPEIALTPQLRARFEERFGGEVAVLHSSLTDKSRREFWWDIRSGKRKLVVGARSALFAPLEDVGLIVVDEEHEPSYKQEDRLRYSARDLALVRARQHGAVAILGSATPSIETFFASEAGKHERLALASRPAGRPLPAIEVVDLRSELRTEGAAPRSVLGRRLREGLAETLIRGEQALVFVNRKGFASFLVCRDCGEVPGCLNCSVSLTYYRAARELRCHYCGFAIRHQERCSACKAGELRQMGMGTELVEDELRALFPEVAITRLDADTATTARKLEDALERFRDGRTRILVGTQMLAKGHDFPRVTLVGVVLADLNLHLPDFRAGERTFQLLAQVAGRAGRRDLPGRVILQTLLPDHYVIQAAARQDYAGFYRAELEHRREFGYPPFTRVAQLEFRHLREGEARDQALRARGMLDRLRPAERGFSYLGPAAASVARVANQFRWQILLRSEKSSALNAVIKTLRKEGVRYIDVDPVSTL